MNGAEVTLPSHSVIQSEVLRRKGNLTTVRTFLGRSAESLKCELTLSAELLASITRKAWCLVEDATTHARYRVKVTTIAAEGCRVPVYFAQEIR